MSNENLIHLLEGLASFNQALNEKAAQDQSIGDRIVQSILPDEMDAMQEKAQSLAIQAMSQAFGGGEPDEEFLKLSIELVEATTKFSLRVISQEELAACMPVDLRNQADADLLRDLGANNLADLCAFDLDIKPTAPTKNAPPKTFHKHKF